MDYEQLEAVERMQKYIADHLTRPITLRLLADAAGYSPYHAARLFAQGTGKPPFVYIRDMRLTAAALRLRDADEIRVLDVALDFLFASHEGFTKAFSRQFGMSPCRYRRLTPPIQLFQPYSVLGQYRHRFGQGGGKMNSEKTRTVFVQVMERPARKLMLKRGKEATEYFSYCGEVGCDVHAFLCSVKEALYEPIGVWLPDGMRPAGTSKYASGVELPADYAGEVPEGFDLIDLMPCKMMVFQGEPFPEEEYPAAISEVWDVMKRYDPGLYGFSWADEIAPRFQLAPEGYRGYIEARPVVDNNK